MLRVSYGFLPATPSMLKGRDLPFRDFRSVNGLVERYAAYLVIASVTPESSYFRAIGWRHIYPKGNHVDIRLVGVQPSVAGKNVRSESYFAEYSRLNVSTMTAGSWSVMICRSFSSALIEDQIGIKCTRRFTALALVSSRTRLDDHGDVTDVRP